MPRRLGTQASRAIAPRLILASGSPRRRDLLERAGLVFALRPAAIYETTRAGEAPEALVERLAREKAAAVAQALDPADAWVVLGSDTVVVLDRDILGKPRDAAHALELLGRLAGHTHRVLTGVAVATARGARALHVESRVSMRRPTQAELRAYVSTGEPFDKAGAYALQGEGGRLVAQVEGSRSNVIGLPLRATLQLLAEVGVEPPELPRPEPGRTR